jgi:SOS response regulatory protein OraA/RecX
VAELRADLGSGFDDATIQAVIERLVSRGLVDDVRLVRTLLEANCGKKAVSMEALQRRCAQRGASELALVEFADADEPAVDELLRRFERTERDRARAYRLLASRGFSEDAIASSLERLRPDGSDDGSC